MTMIGGRLKVGDRPYGIFDRGSWDGQFRRFSCVRRKYPRGPGSKRGGARADRGGVGGRLYSVKRIICSGVSQGKNTADVRSSAISFCEWACSPALAYSRQQGSMVKWRSSCRSPVDSAWRNERRDENCRHSDAEASEVETLIAHIVVRRHCA